MEGINNADLHEKTWGTETVQQILDLYQQHCKDGVVKHIPLINFHNDVASGNLDAVVGILHHLPEEVKYFVLTTRVDYSLPAVQYEDMEQKT